MPHHGHFSHSVLWNTPCQNLSLLFLLYLLRSLYCGKHHMPGLHPSRLITNHEQPPDWQKRIFGQNIGYKWNYFSFHLPNRIYPASSSEHLYSMRLHIFHWRSVFVPLLRSCNPAHPMQSPAFPDLFPDLY